MHPTPNFHQGFSIQVLQDYETLCREAAGRVLTRLRAKPDLLLCASAGGTPTGLYASLAGQAANQPELFAQMRVLQIDEWGGLPPEHPASCKTDLQTKLIQPLGIAAERFIGFDAHAADPESETRRISAWLTEHGPIDVCILGLGLNGHLAMNEPGDVLFPRAHVAILAESTLRHGMLRDLAVKPTWGLTLGMADIMNSVELLLLANGPHKREPVDRLREPKISSWFPASFLWLHPRATAFLDHAAYGLPPGDLAEA